MSRRGAFARTVACAAAAALACGGDAVAQGRVPAEATFTFTVPVQLSALPQPLRTPEIVCGVGTGTTTGLGVAGSGIMQFASHNFDGTRARIVGEGRTPVPASGVAYAGSVVVTVNAPSPAVAATAHSYACALFASGGILRNQSDHVGTPYDPATFRVLVTGTIQ